MAAEAAAQAMAAESGTIETELTPEQVSAEPVTVEAVSPEPLTAEGVISGAVTSELLTAEPAMTAALTSGPRPHAPAPAQVASNDGWSAPPDREEEAGEPEDEPAQRPPALGAVLGVLVIVAVIWVGVRMLSGHSGPAPPPLPPVQAPVAAAQEQPAAPISAGSISREAAAAATRSTIHEFIPEVPALARRSVRGHIKVWVRVIVNRDGSVFAATPDRAGSSRYFERLALESAKKWTFPATEASSQRLMQIRFDFSREGATARSVTLR
jgi:outer membrane biosynthesis protein TonB